MAKDAYEQYVSYLARRAAREARALAEWLNTWAAAIEAMPTRTISPPVGSAGARLDSLAGELRGAVNVGLNGRKKDDDHKEVDAG